MNPLFPCDHGDATHSCIEHEVGRGTVCKNAPGVALLGCDGGLGLGDRHCWLLVSLCR